MTELKPFPDEKELLHPIRVRYKKENATIISFLVNSIYYFIDYAVILCEEAGYRLAVVRKETILIDRYYQSLPQAKEAFLLSVQQQCVKCEYKEEFRPIWEDKMLVDNQWLLEKLAFLNRRHRPGQITFLLNCCRFYLDTVFIMVQPNQYRLVVIHGKKKRLDKPFPTLAGAKDAFRKFFFQQGTGPLRVKSHWSAVYEPQTHWLIDRLRFPLKRQRGRKKKKEK